MRHPADSSGLRPLPATATLAEAGGEKRPRLVLVDDEAEVREVAEALLQDAGYAVASFADGEQAWAALQAGLPADALLLDVTLPGISGVDLAGRVQAARPGLPLVFMTGLHESELPPDLDFVLLPKPYRFADLQAAVRRALGDRER